MTYKLTYTTQKRANNNKNYTNIIKTKDKLDIICWSKFLDLKKIKHQITTL